MCEKMKAEVNWGMEDTMKAKKSYYTKWKLWGLCI